MNVKRLSVGACCPSIEARSSTKCNEFVRFQSSRYVFIPYISYVSMYVYRDFIVICSRMQSLVLLCYDLLSYRLYPLPFSHRNERALSSSAEPQTSGERDRTWRTHLDRDLSRGGPFAGTTLKLEHVKLFEDWPFPCISPR